MTTVSDIYNYIKTLAPEYMAEDWDHVGLLCGRADREVKRVLIALDPFRAVCEEAKTRDCQLLLTHHACLWELKAVNDQTQMGRNLLFLVENGISAVNAHTNLDFAPEGVNDCLAKKLGLREIGVIDPIGTDARGRAYGLLRGGNTAACQPAAFAAFVKEKLGCEGVRFADGGKPIARVAVGGGSCAGLLSRVAELGYDAFVTADVKYNAFNDARDLGVTLVDAGHFETENPVCAYLAEKVRAAFPKIEVFLSEVHTDCIKFE